MWSIWYAASSSQDNNVRENVAHATARAHESSSASSRSDAGVPEEVGRCQRDTAAVVAAAAADAGHGLVAVGGESSAHTVVIRHLRRRTKGPLGVSSSYSR